MYCLLLQTFLSYSIVVSNFSFPPSSAPCFAKRVTKTCLKSTKHDYLSQRSGSGEAGGSPHVPCAPHPPLRLLYPSTANFSRRKNNKGLAGLFTQCKIELAEVCEEHGLISMGMRRSLSLPPQDYPMQLKVAFGAGGWASPCQPCRGKIKVMSELGWPCWVGGLARAGK